MQVKCEQNYVLDEEIKSQFIYIDIVKSFSKTNMAELVMVLSTPPLGDPELKFWYIFIILWFSM